MSGNKNTVKDNRAPSSGNALYNAVQLMIENTLSQKVNTAELVMVTAVEPGGTGGAAGYVTIKPMVGQLDAKGDMLEPVECFKVPYSRMQGGGAAIVMDPEVGDVGLAVFTKHDSSGVKQEQGSVVPPASFRTFDQANGMYMGPFLNKTPETWIEFTPDKKVVIHAPENARIETKSCEIECETANIKGDQVTLESPETVCTGNFTVNGGFSGFNGGPAIFKNGIVNQAGGLANNGGLTNTGGALSSNNITLDTHTHAGVQGGGSNTQKPNEG